MSMLSEFFVATDADAVGFGERVHHVDATVRRRRYHPAEWQGISDIELAMFWAILLREPFHADRHELMLVQMGEDGGEWLYRFPDRFVLPLSRLADASIAGLAADWSRAPDMEGWELATLEKLILDLRKLAGEALAAHKGLFLWGSLRAAELPDDPLREVRGH